MVRSLFVTFRVVTIPRQLDLAMIYETPRCSLLQTEEPDNTDLRPSDARLSKRSVLPLPL